MSDGERDEIFSVLKVIRSLIVWLGGGAFLAVIALVGLLISDHFEQKSLREDVEWMRPKVERLWYRSDSARYGEPGKTTLVSKR